MKLIDSHCHIHESEFFDSTTQQEVYERALAADIAMICVATSESASKEAIAFVDKHENTWAVLGVHPHEAKHGCDLIGELLAQRHSKVVGIGEIGLDYHYNHSSPEIQHKILEQQLQWAQDYNLPVSFHIRQAFDDFWPIFDNFHGIKGVLHSFTDSAENLEAGFSRGLYVGVNGISTFTKDNNQQQLYSSIPLEKMLLETDAPFLTPAPLRGRINEPKYIGMVAQHMADLRSVASDVVNRATTTNARRLFDI